MWQRKSMRPWRQPTPKSVPASCKKVKISFSNEISIFYWRKNAGGTRCPVTPQSLLLLTPTMKSIPVRRLRKANSSVTRRKGQLPLNTSQKGVFPDIFRKEECFLSGQLPPPLWQENFSLRVMGAWLEKLVSRKKPKYYLETFSSLRRLKHLGVRIITWGGSTYHLTTIAQTCRQEWWQILRVFMLESNFRWVRVPFKGSSNAINGNFKVIISRRL